jgi:hypothetical protein
MKCSVLSGRAVVAFALLLLVGCESAYYGVNEQFGRLKNDILVDRVEDAMDAQQDAKEEFQSAFEQFESVVGVEETDLKKAYRKLSGSFEDAQSKADDVRDRIDAVDDVSGDLFSEWETELGQISNADLRNKSREQLRISRTKYKALIGAMKQAESRMQPVLTSFQDHVLFLKHNLNAQAIASLKSELGTIENNVGRLIAEMEHSIAQAQSFIKDMKA